MNPFIEFLIETKGVPETTIILLLMLPLVATFVSVWRQVIGLRTFGIYAPIIMAFTFYELASEHGSLDFFQGLKYGIVLALVVFLSAGLAHELTRRFRLHYLPKMSLVLTVVTIAMFCTISLATILDKGGFFTINAFSLLLMITVSEQMISLYIKKGRKTAYLLTGITLIISILMYLLISWRALQELVLEIPYIVLLTLPINFIIGKWTGFRVKELFRFKTLLSPNEPE